MNRRTFLTDTGVAGAGICLIGVASAPTLLASSPWSLLPGFQHDEIEHLDRFAGNLKRNLEIYSGHDTSINSYVMPVDVVYRKRDGDDYLLVYRNSISSYVQLVKKGEKRMTKIALKKPDFV